MGVNGQHKTALGVAKARFIEALPRKAKELDSAVALLKESPGVMRLREEMRRRLHALYASAQVFREDALAKAVKAAIERLDRSRDSQNPLAEEDLEALANLASALPSLCARTSSKPPASQESERSVSPVPQGPSPAPAGSDSAADSAGPGETDRGGREIPDNQTLVSVLVLEDARTAAQIKELLPAERFEVLATSDPEEALRLARSSAPDLVLAEHVMALNPEVGFIARLRGDPLTDLVPVFLLMPAGTAHDAAKIREAGAEQVIFKPIDGWALLRSIGALLLGPSKLNSAFDNLSEATVDEVADKVAEEIRQGLAEALQAGKDRKIPLGEGHEI